MVFLIELMTDCVLDLQLLIKKIRHWNAVPDFFEGI